MSFTLNRKFKTELTMEEVAYIAVACGEYQRLYGDSADKDVLKTMRNLVNRLGHEMSDNPDNKKPNGH